MIRPIAFHPDFLPEYADESGSTRYECMIMYVKLPHKVYNCKLYDLISSEGVFTNVDVPDIGNLREIRFSPEKPSKIYRPLMGTRVGSVFLGVMCIGMAVLALVVMHR